MESNDLTFLEQLAVKPTLEEELNIEKRVLGPNRRATMTVAQDIKRYLNTLDGLVNLESTLPVPGVEWELFVDKPKAAKFGADIPTIGNSIGLITSGLTIGSYRPKDIDEELDILSSYVNEQKDIKTYLSNQVNIMKKTRFSFYFPILYYFGEFLVIFLSTHIMLAYTFTKWTYANNLFIAFWFLISIALKSHVVGRDIKKWKLIKSNRFI